MLSAEGRFLTMLSTDGEITFFEGVETIVQNYTRV